jgi:hypothetical protein
MRGGSEVGVEQMTRDEVEAFTQRLEDFGATLTPRERGLLHEILHRAGGEIEDVEAHGVIRTSIAASVLAAAAALGVTAAVTAGHVSPASHAQSSHPGAKGAHPAGYWIEDDKGGRQYIRYSR